MDVPIPLCIRDLHKSFKQGSAAVEILKGISVEAKKGEFIAIMGPSGSGKSTLLHVIAGLTGCDSGSVEIAGASIAGLSDAKLTAMRRKNIGFVFQSFNLIPTLNVRENILLPLLAGGSKIPEEKLKKLADKLGIADKFARMPWNLSGGEQQRVAIARALLPDPALILADEPTGSLDTAAGQSLCKTLHDICAEEQRTILMVTHEPAVACWAGRTLILKDGRLAGELLCGGNLSAQDLAIAYQKVLDSANPEA